MAIQRTFPQPGKMFATPQHACFGEAGKKLAYVPDRFPRIVRNRARTHHAFGSFKRQVSDRRKIHVESQRPAILADHSPMLAKELAVPCSKYLSRRRSWSNHIPQP